VTEEFTWFVGVDWASQSHQVCLVDARGEGLAERTVAHGGSGIAELCDWLLARTAARAEAIAVAIEVPHGPVVEALLERGFRVHAINPKQLDRFRDRFTVAGAKSLPSRKRGMTGAMHGCSPTACAPTAMPTASCRPTIR
jgi:transposase